MKCLLFASMLFIVGCVSTKVIPIKGTYPETPIVISSTKSFDQAWDRLVDIFAQKGLSIKIIDRSSGLIISTKSELTTPHWRKGVGRANEGWQSLYLTINQFFDK